MRRTTVLVLAALAAAAAEAWALPPPDDYAYTTNEGSANVSVFIPPNPPPNPPTQVRVVTVGTAPWGIVAVPSRKKVYVSNSGATPGTISVIDSETLQVVNTVPVADSINLKGMSLSVDESAIFIAGRNNTLGEAGVFRLDLATESASYVAGISTAASAADCVVINSGVVLARVTGSGGPTKVYFSVPGNDFVGVIDLAGPSTSSIGILGEAAAPGNMERSPDHAVVYAACADAGATVGSTVVEIEVATDIPRYHLLAADSVPHATNDVTFRQDTLGAPFRAYVVGTGGAGLTLWEFSVTPGLPPAGIVSTGVPAGGLTVAHNVKLYEDRLYLGATSSTSFTFGMLDSSSSPPAANPPTSAAFGPESGPINFAFAPQPQPPKIISVEPNFFSGVGAVVTVRGQGFQPGAMWSLDTDSTPPFDTPVAGVTFIDSNVVRLTMPGAPLGTYALGVANPDTQVGMLGHIITSTATPLTASINVLPGTSPPEYQMFSFPLFATAGDLRAALEARFGPYDPIFWRAFTDMEGTGYLELPGWPPNRSITGRAMWLLSRNGGSVVLTGTDTDDAGGVQESMGLVLWPGWNMVSTPVDGGNGNTPLANVEAGPGFGNTSPVGPAHPQGIDRFHKWDRPTAQYMVETAALVPGEGYFLFNPQPGPLYLKFADPAPPKSLGPARSVLVPLGPGDPQPPPPPGFRVASSSSGGCGLFGPEFLLLAFLRFAFTRGRGRRKLGA